MDEHNKRREMRAEEMPTPAPRRKKKRKTVPQLILQDLLMIAIILLGFALVHHVIPRMLKNSYDALEPKDIRPSISETPAPETALPLQTDTGEPSEQPEPDITPEPTPEPTPDPMDWRTKFADHFTDEVVVTDHSYTSPNIAIDIQKFVTDDPAPSTYFVADIYVAQLENFQTYWAGGSFRKWMEEDPIQIAKNSGAILSINGDYADSQLQRRQSP